MGPNVVLFKPESPAAALSSLPLLSRFPAHPQASPAFCRRVLSMAALTIALVAASIMPAKAAIDTSTASAASATTAALASPTSATPAASTTTPAAASATPAAASATSTSASSCDPNVETALNQVSQGNQEYMSQVTKQLLPPPPSVAQLSCFDYQVKLMANNVLSRFTSSGSASLGSILGGGPINDLLGVPFQTFVQGSVNPLSALSSITNNLTSTITSALTSSISTAIGVDTGANPALCNVMSKLWDLVQCSGFLDNLPQLPSLNLGSSLMGNSCASKVLFDAALGAMKTASFGDTTSFSSNTTFVTKIESGYK